MAFFVWLCLSPVVGETRLQSSSLGMYVSECAPTRGAQRETSCRLLQACFKDGQSRAREAG